MSSTTQRKKTSAKKHRNAKTTKTQTKSNKPNNKKNLQKETEGKLNKSNALVVEDAGQTEKGRTATGTTKSAELSNDENKISSEAESKTAEKKTMVEKVEYFRLEILPAAIKRATINNPILGRIANAFVGAVKKINYTALVIGVISLLIILAMTVPSIIGAIEYYRLGVWDMF